MSELPQVFVYCWLESCLPFASLWPGSSPEALIAFLKSTAGAELVHTTTTKTPSTSSSSFLLLYFPFAFVTSFGLELPDPTTALVHPTTTCSMLDGGAPQPPSTTTTSSSKSSFSRRTLMASAPLMVWTALVAIY